MIAVCLNKLHSTVQVLFKHSKFVFRGQTDDLRWFRYETELPWVLKGLSFSIQPGAGLDQNSF